MVTPVVAQQRDDTVATSPASTSKPRASLTAPLHPHASGTGLSHQGIGIVNPDSQPPSSHALIHESGLVPTDSLPSFPLHSPSKRERRLQAFIYPASGAQNPILSLHQPRFRPFVLPDNTAPPDHLYSQAEYHRKRQPNNSVSPIATPPATPTKIPDTLRHHPRSSPQQKSTINLARQGHRGRDHLGALCEKQTPSNSHCGNKNQQSSPSPTKPLDTTEEDDMPLSLRVKDLHPFPRRSNSTCTTASTRSTALSPTHPKPSILTAATGGHETITVPADSPSQSPLVLESAPTPSNGSKGGIQGRIWYRKISQWPPSEFEDPFAAGPLVVLAGGQSKKKDACMNATEKPGMKALNRAKGMFLYRWCLPP